MKLVGMVLVGLVASKPALAEEHDVGAYVAVGGLAANTAFTIYNLVTIGERKSDMYAVGESMLTVPQTIVFGSLAAMADDDDWKMTGLAVWAAALALHGIITLTTDDEEPMGRTVMLSIGERF